MPFSFRNTRNQYGLGGRILHWTSVTLLLTLILTADGFQDLGPGANRALLVKTHASWGLLFLLVMAMRVGWRLSNLNPIRSYSIRMWQKTTAVFLHWTIYIVVITQGLAGLLNLVYGGSSIAFFSVFELAAVMDREEGLYDLFRMIHYVLSVVIYPLFAIHISAAIYHQLFGVLDDD
ncbi:MAG: cytochrome b [Gammaproteobacteria bacterium]|nr:cytochrome b [Gammaproteobacteria bacterium]